MKQILCILVGMACCIPAALTQNTVTLSPIKDNTIYEDPTGQTANGSGRYLFAGRNNENSENLRRLLLAFDYGAIPAGMMITNVELELTVSKTKTASLPFDLHRLTKDWGEGDSDGGIQEGKGGQAEAPDATWLHARFESVNWDTPGGDFEATVSGSANVDGPGSYTWSDAQMVVDVQYWYENPNENHGWILIGDESQRSTKRFFSREENDASRHPKLVVTYEEAASIFLPTYQPLRLYPNPVQDQLQIEMPGHGEAMVQVLDLNGRSIYETTTREQQVQINMGALPKGLYFVRIRQDGLLYRERILKN